MSHLKLLWYNIWQKEIIMKQLKIDSFLDYQYLAGLQTSPEKEHMSFTLAKANYDANNYNHELYLSNGEEHTKVLNLKEDARYFWENEENILYFNDQGDSDEKLKELKYTLVYRYNLKTKDSELAYQFKIPVGSIKAINSKTLLLTASLKEEDHKLLSNDITRQNYINKESKNTYFEVFDEVPFQSNGGGFTQKKRSQAFIYDIEDESYTALSNANTSVGAFEFNDKKDKLYFVSSEETGLPVFFDDICVYDVNTKETTTLYTDKKVSISRLIPLKDELYVMGADNKKHGVNQNPDFYILNGSELDKVLQYGLSTNAAIGSDARFGALQTTRIINNKFHFIGTMSDRTCLYSFDGKNLEAHFTPEGSLDTFVDFKDKFYTIGLFNNKLQELYLCDFKTNEVIQKSEFNADVLKDTYIAQPIHHSFVNDDQDLDGWVLLPQDYDKNKTYPAILDIHGGPKTIYSNVFYHEMQAWVNQGYIVFFTNPRGGDAYGDDFANIRGKYGTIDFDDIMAFTDLVEKEYSIDPDRLGVTGGSYGGFMTNWIVGHTDRFKAAATQRSISNWISFYGTSDIGSYFGPDQTDAHPLDDHDKAWEQSPLKHANNIKTPLLFIHSDEDYRCPIEQAMQLYTVVKMNGVDTRFVWFKGENHDLSRSGKPQGRLKRLEEITDWMNKYLDNKQS